MKNKVRFFAKTSVGLLLLFSIMQCSDGKEKTVTLAPKSAVQNQQQVTAQKTDKLMPKSILPKKLLDLGLTEELQVKCEAAYKEIFTPDILAQRREMGKKLQVLEKDSEGYKQAQKEINEKFKPYSVAFNKKLKVILTREQQERYWGKIEK